MENIQLVLMYENTDYQTMNALSLELAGQLNILKRLLNKLEPLANMIGDNDIIDYLFEISMGIPQWEGWVGRVNSRIKELETSTMKRPTQPAQNNSKKPVKFTTSEFPKFDGISNYHNWWARWEHLASISGMDDDNLEVKIKESLVDEVEELIGKTIMATGSYKDVCKKLKSIYDKPVERMQETTKDFFSISLEDQTLREIRKFIEASKDILLRVEQNELNAESLMMNFIIMQIPQKLRDKMVPVLNRKCPSFKITEKN